MIIPAPNGICIYASRDFIGMQLNFAIIAQRSTVSYLLSDRGSYKRRNGKRRNEKRRNGTEKRGKITRSPHSYAPSHSYTLSLV